MQSTPAIESRAPETRPQAISRNTSLRVDHATHAQSAPEATPDRTLRATSYRSPNLSGPLDGEPVLVFEYVCQKDARHIRFYRRDGEWTCGVCYPQSKPPKVI
jgi:hypothetical protein